MITGFSPQYCKKTNSTSLFHLIIYMKKLYASNWMKTCAFFMNTSAKL